jgi:hypothetical protein
MNRILLLLIVLAGSSAPAAPLGTAFSYSGRLKYQNNPANGSFDLQVKLFDAASGGNQVGGTANVNALSIVNGLFVTSLDFGGGPFNGTAYWLEIAARPNGNGSFTILTPRQPVNAAPYALYAPKADTANTAAATAVNSVSAASIQSSSITSNKIASGQVVKTLDGLTDDVTLAAGTNVSLTRNGNTLTISSGGPSGWSLAGNPGTSPGVNFIGTTDNQALELKVNNVRAWRLEPAFSFIGPNSINTLGGHVVNRIFNGAIGGTIGGGGSFDALVGDAPNEVSANFGTIGGGAFNSIAGAYGTIPGGFGNQASGEGSFAAGELARAQHDGSFVWGDGTASTTSSGPHSFVVRASGGFNALTTFLQVSGAGNERAYLGGDGAGGDVQIGSLNPAVATVAFYNAGNNTYMNLYAESLGVNGTGTFGGNFVTVNGSGGEMAYLGGDGIGGDVQIGSLNANIHNVALYNATAGQYMDLFIRTLTLFGGADLAEPFEMSDESGDIPKGAVVIIDEKNPGHLKISERAYDTSVAGVISGAGGVNPGIQLQQTGVLAGGQNVALTGRVYVQADATLSPIKPGDLLTTSDTRGHAMKVSDPGRAQGAILGKAMTRLENKRGLVLVLVTLQ